MEVQIHRTKRKFAELDRSKSTFKVEIKKLYNTVYYCRKKKKRVEGNIVQNKVQPATSTASSLKLTPDRTNFGECEVNIRAVLSAFYIGTGGGDVSKVLGMLGVGGSLSFERNFTKYSPKISKIVREVCDKLIYECFVEEIMVTMKEKYPSYNDEDKLKELKQYLIKKQFNKLPNHLPVIDISISYDMGWQRRSSGRLYDSLSGHAYFIGCRTGKVIMRGVMQKKCSICTSYNKRDLPVPEHTCNINHEGSSGSMESILCRKLLEEVHVMSFNKVAVGEVVSDDDSTLRSYCSLVSNGGSLSPGVREPKYLADPSHRAKVWVKPVFKMVKQTKKQDEVKKIDAMRLKKYITCYITQYREGDFEYFFKNALAPLEHLFDSHLFCDKKWCWHKELEERSQQIIQAAKN